MVQHGASSIRLAEFPCSLVLSPRRGAAKWNSSPSGPPTLVKQHVQCEQNDLVPGSRRGTRINSPISSRSCQRYHVLNCTCTTHASTENPSVPYQPHRLLPKYISIRLVHLADPIYPFTRARGGSKSSSQTTRLSMYRYTLSSEMPRISVAHGHQAPSAVSSPGRFLSASPGSVHKALAVTGFRRHHRLGSTSP